MNPPLVGVTHHLLCPSAWTSGEEHEATLATALAAPVDGVDLFGPPGLEPDRIEREAAAIRASGKRIVYCTPLLHHEQGCDPSGCTPALRERALARAKEHLAVARRFGAKLITVVSGFDPAEASRPTARAGFRDFLVALAAEAAPLPVAIEPMDVTIDKRALVGPTREAAALVDEARARGADNLGLIVDMAHLPLLGESFGEALDATGERLRHVHLGNCLLTDCHDPLYGDQHPPLDYPGGEHGPAELNAMLAELAARDYFARPEPSLSFEIRPATGEAPLETLRRHLAWLAEGLARCGI